MIVADTVTDITVEQALNAYLTGVLWGREVGTNQWQWVSSGPTLQPPTPDSTTFYKHLEKLMVRTPLDRVALRLAVGDFVHTDMGAAFQDYHSKHLKLLEWRHQTRDPLMTLRGPNGNHYHYILPSIYRLIQHLHDSQRDFSLVIRTYGLDCTSVLKSMDHALTSKTHPQFPDLPDLRLNPTAGSVVRQPDSIHLQAFEDSLVSADTTDEDMIYKYLSEVEGVCGFRDDFLYWQNNDYHHKCAKPLWIDPTDRSCRHIFFDDNYRINTDDSIVDIRERDPLTGGWRSADGAELEAYDGMALVQVDLLQAIANENYFVEKVIDCENKYDARVN